MPEIRSVSVRLDADVASYIAKMKAAGEATDHAFGSSSRNIGETNSALKGTETELGKVDTAARKVDTSMRGLDQRNQSVTRSQDRLTGGMRILVNTALALGPALVPIGAVAIPAVAGLTSELGAAVIGVGVTELAFHGLGKALTAFNKAELSPTTANIQAAQTAMASLPPSAQALVLELHKLSPVLTDLRQSAASGLAPGVTSGLRSLLTDAPLVERGVHGIASELGDLTAQAGRALAGPEWRGFLRTVGQQTPVALHDMGVATGAVVHGLAQLYLAFGPSLGSFDQGVVKVADDFDRWATSLGQTKDFQSFMAYVATNGPRVVSLLGDTAGLLGSIVKAAAPLGGPTLEALDGIVKVLDAIAKSPLGTPILLLAQLNGVLHLTNNLLGLMGVTARIGFTGITRGAATAEAATEGETGALATLKATVLQVGRNVGSNAAEGTPLLAGVSSSGVASLIKGGLYAGGIGLIASGAASKLGVANTATLALAGSLAGPLGAGAGAAVGALLDVSHATEGVTSATKQAQQALGGWDIGTKTTDLANLNAQIAHLHQMESFTPSSGGSILDRIAAPFKGFEAYATRGFDFLTGKSSAASSVQSALSTQSGLEKTALYQAYAGLSGKAATSELPVSQLDAVQQKILPAMNALGISQTQLNASAAAGGPAFDHLISEIVKYTQKAGATQGATAAVAQAFSQMSDSLLTPAERAQALTTALDNLIDPMLNLGSAKDTFRQGLNDLSTGLSKSSRSLVGNTDAVIQNRDAIRTQVTNLKSWIEAEANAHVPASKMLADLQSGRQAIIEQGKAAGLNADQIRHMLDVMNLTPRSIQTQIKVNGTGQAISELDQIQNRLATLHDKTVHVNIFTNATVADPSHLTPHKAGGGPIVGPGGPTSDRVPIWASNGEFMMRSAAVDRYGMGFMHAVNAGRFAGGGAIGQPAGGVPSNIDVYIGDSLGAAANGAASGLRSLRVESTALTKVQSQEQAQLQKIQQARASLVSTVRGGFLPQLFGSTAPGSSTWSANGGLLDPLHLVNQNIHQARAYTRDLHRLRGRGLRGAALAQVTTLADAHQALGLSPHEDRLLTQRYQVLERASRQAGRTAGDFRYGAKLDDIRGEIHKTNEHLHTVEAELKHRRAEAKKQAKTTGDAVAAGVNSGVTGGVRRQKAWT